MWVTMAVAVGLWVPMLVGLWVLSERFGRPRFAPQPFVDEYGLRFKVVDLVGVPIGVLSQLVVLRLRLLAAGARLAGHVQSLARRAQRPRPRTTRRTAAGSSASSLIVVIGAPIVEELMYRGLLQGAAVRRLNDAVAVVVVAAFFALIHFRWVELPGLFVFGLVLGVCALRTGRLGMSIVAHMAFNATGLLLVAWQ